MKLSPIQIAIATIVIIGICFIAYNSYQTRKMAENAEIMQRANALMQSAGY